MTPPPLTRTHAIAATEQALQQRGDKPLALLYSGREGSGSGRHSYLATQPEETLISNHFHTLEAKLSGDHPALQNAWFGWLGYGLKHDVETLPPDTPSFIALSPLWMTRFQDVQRFAHTPTAQAAIASDYTPPAITALHSNMSKAEYLEKVERTLEQIRSGAFYQANITRKFYGEFASLPDRFALFKRLCAISPAPYSAYLQWEDTAILSSSPECFLRIAADGRAESRPIKGSMGRGTDPEADARNLHHLQHSAKDRAENLMIADLMRNDLSRGCAPGSVITPELHATTSYATVHHMHSTVCGQKSPHISTLELVKHCFPPGSMTGAPKIRAIEWCSAMEQQARGVYSGALGWFGGDGSCDLSVVIRTLILQGKRFEFQVGGAIVADSDPVREWEETLVKATAIAEALGLRMEQLEG